VQKTKNVARLQAEVANQSNTTLTVTQTADARTLDERGCSRQVRSCSRRFMKAGRMMIFCAATAAVAQQLPAADQEPKDDSRRSRPVAFFTTLQRQSFVFPDIATSKNPLSTRQKFELFVNNSISVSSLFSSTVGSAITQASNSPEGYGQGGEGYAKRFGSSMARNASSNFFGTFLLASTLHQDPRFYPQKDPTFGRSVKYSVQRLFVTRTDSGASTANWSGLLGPLVAEGLANAYWPERERTTGDTLQRYGIDLAATVGYNMLRNYWPVFFKRMRGSSPDHLPEGNREH
jgi:hypothetical protein